MAKIRRCKLSWKPSDSDRVISYRLYWSKGDTLTYDSSFFELGNICEVYLPDILKLNPRYEVRVMIGLTAVDLNGNESDMVILSMPYQTIAPLAPASLSLTSMDGFSVLGSSGNTLKPIDLRIEEDSLQDELEYPRHRRDPQILSK